ACVAPCERPLQSAFDREPRFSQPRIFHTGDRFSPRGARARGRIAGAVTALSGVLKSGAQSLNLPVSSLNGDCHSLPLCIIFLEGIAGVVQLARDVGCAVMCRIVTHAANS